MAIYHLTVKNISRGEGRSAVASAAYRRAECLFDERLNCYQDYSHKPDVIYKELTIPSDAPDWVKALKEIDREDKVRSSEKLWNRVEFSEKQCNARLAKEIELALPMELTQEQSIVLVREFIEDQCVNRGMIADWAVHWDTGNPHVHVMLTTRHLTPEGFGLKNRDWNAKSLVQAWRESWTMHANYHLALHQHDVRIDHRSYEAQGIDLVPGIHQGRAVREMQMKGKVTSVWQEVSKIRRENLQRIKHDPAIVLKKIHQERTTFTFDQVAYEVGRYCEGAHGLAGQVSLFHPHTIAMNAPIGDEQSSAFAPEAFYRRESHQTSEGPSVLSAETITEILKHIEQHESVFGEHALAKALFLHIDEAQIFAKALTELKASDELLYLGVGDDGRDRYTTRRMFGLENQLQMLADKLRHQRHAVIHPGRKKAALKAFESLQQKTLTDEQLAAVRYLTTSQSIGCLVGRAGTGKSFTLGAATQVWKAQGLRVLGVALQGIAAEGLAKESQMTSSDTIASFTESLARGHLTLTPQDVVVMDEAGMTDSISMLAVLEAVEKAKAKLVLAGDPAQLQPVGPGAVFRALLERLGYTELQAVYRQREDWQRQATQDFSQGQMEKALNAYAEKGCIHWLETSEVALQRLLQDWHTLRTHQDKPLDQYLILAHQNTEVTTLNRLARERRIQHFEMDDGSLVNTIHGEKAFSVGDRILFLKNDKRLGVKNGRFASIEKIELAESGQVWRIHVRLDGEQGQCISFQPETYAHFTHGYAATVHKVQGMTVDHNFVYVGNRGWDRQLTYVAKTRHRYTSHLYADKATFSTVKQLKKQLSRYRLKDSVLDFPLSFAERRGMDISALLGQFTQHLIQRLVTFKQTLTDKYHQIFNPQDYWLEKAALKTTLEKQLTQAQQRQDAKVVAAYVDANREVGAMWEALRQKASQLGMETSDYRSPHDGLLVGTLEYRALQDALSLRDELASILSKDLARYRVACDLYGLETEKLANEAKRHALRQAIQQYQSFCQREQSVLRDRLAAYLTTHIKEAYGLLKQANVDTKALRKQAEAHHRRLYLGSLTSPERTAFHIVDQYVALNQQLSQVYHELNIAKENNRVISHRTLDTLNTLTQARNQLAAQIYTPCDAYVKGLDFYRLGLSPSILAQQALTEADKQKLQQRWYQLQQHAMRHTIHQRVKAYQLALLANDTVKRYTLAHQIVEEAKAHHGAVIAQAPVPSALWRAIRDDAKAYTKAQLLATLTLDEQADFRVVESYVNEQRAAASAWREIFATKETLNLPPAVLNEKLIPLAKTYAHQRDTLAAQILLAPSRYQRGCDYYQLDLNKLQAQGLQHENRQRVMTYQEALQKHERFTCEARLAQAQLAHTICQALKAHTSAILEFNVDWKTLFTEANRYEQHLELAELSPEERKLYRLIGRYRKVNRQVGQRFSKLIRYKQQKKRISEKISRQADQLLAKREAIAWRLYDQKETLAWQWAFDDKAITSLAIKIPQHDKVPLNWEKIEKQAQQHARRVAQVNDFVAAYTDWMQQVTQLTSATTITSGQYESLLQEKTALLDMAQVIGEKLPHYHVVLQQQGLTPDRFLQSLSPLKQLTMVLEKMQRLQAVKFTSVSTLDREQQKRIAWAQAIAKKTQRLKGTLAERYLREHRHITGTLSNSFRYGANVYCAQIKRHLPALVVLAHNAQHQVQAVQVIYLDPKTGNKANIANPKLTYGVLKGAAVRVNSGKSPQTVALAEGPETALSIKAANPDITVYATLGASNFAKVPLPAQTHRVLLCADNDGENAASMQQLRQAAEHFAEKGISVYQAMPVGNKQDFNDVLKTHGKEAVSDALKQAHLILKGQTIETTQDALKALIEKATHHPNTFIISDYLTLTEAKHLTDYLQAYESYEKAYVVMMQSKDETEKAQARINRNQAAQYFEQQVQKLVGDRVAFKALENKTVYTLGYLQTTGNTIAALCEKIKVRALTLQELSLIVKSIKSHSTSLSAARTKGKSRVRGR